MSVVIEDIILDYVSNPTTAKKFSIVLGRPLIVGSPVGNRTMWLVDMNKDNGTRSLVNAQFKSAVYKYRTPVSLWKTAWITRDAVEETIGKYIKDFPWETSFASGYPHGDTRNLDLFSTYIGDNYDTLEDINTIHHKMYVELTIPIDGDYPVFGEKLLWTDESLRYPLTGYIRVRSRRDDYAANLMTLEGEGEFSFV